MQITAFIVVIKTTQTGTCSTLKFTKWFTCFISSDPLNNPVRYTVLSSQFCRSSSERLGDLLEVTQQVLVGLRVHFYCHLQSAAHCQKASHARSWLVTLSRFGNSDFQEAEPLSGNQSKQSRNWRRETAERRAPLFSAATSWIINTLFFSLLFSASNTSRSRGNAFLLIAKLYNNFEDFKTEFI